MTIAHKKKHGHDHHPPADPAAAIEAARAAGFEPTGTPRRKPEALRNSRPAKRSGLRTACGIGRADPKARLVGADHEAPDGCGFDPRGSMPNRRSEPEQSRLRRHSQSKQGRQTALRDPRRIAGDQRESRSETQALRPLLALNFFMADMQAGIGPFSGRVSARAWLAERLDRHGDDDWRHRRHAW